MIALVSKGRPELGSQRLDNIGGISLFAQHTGPTLVLHASSNQRDYGVVQQERYRELKPTNSRGATVRAACIPSPAADFVRNCGPEWCELVAVDTFDGEFAAG